MQLSSMSFTPYSAFVNGRHCQNNIVHIYIVTNIEQKDHISSFLLIYAPRSTRLIMRYYLKPWRSVSVVMVRSWHGNRSYLTERIQTFQVERKRSTTFIFSCRVLQGSVLGPQKCIAYTEDLPAVIGKRSVDPYLYADDGQFSVHLPTRRKCCTAEHGDLCWRRSKLVRVKAPTT